MSHVFPRDTRVQPPVAVGGAGIHLIDRQGRRYLDASGGAAVSSLGHGHPRIVEALRRQAETLAFVHSGFFTSEAAEELADVLIAHAPPGMDRVYLLSGGSEAVETALKMARQYFIETGDVARRTFISRRQSYHGNTLGALAAGGNEWRREPYRPLLMDVPQISPCFSYRFKNDDETDEAYGHRVADELERCILKHGPNAIAGFIAETVVGATSGAVTPVPGYFRRIREICDRYGVLLILDEVMCGMGRTGTLHACLAEGVVPDLLVMAKGLGAGYQPVGAVLVQKKIYDAFAGGSGFFQHGHTFSAHPMACAAALAVQKCLLEDGVLGRVAPLGDALQAALEQRFGNHHHVGNIRGRGLLQAIELVENRASKAPFDPSHRLSARIKQQAFQRGLMVYPMGGTIDGRAGDHVLLAPPFIASETDMNEIADRLGEAVDAAIATIGR
ncbi:MAG TPA: aspartate aminotransferase family protein [Alphaproteobacteria bacterium]